MKSKLQKKRGIKIAAKETFEQIVRQTPDISTGYRTGLNALGVHSSKIDAKDKSQLEGSVDIDLSTTKKYPQASRWDYVLSYKSELYFVEVHSANTREVRAVLNKLQWLKDWLHSQAPKLNAKKAKECFYWVQSKNFQIPANTPQYLAAIKAGIRPVKMLKLD